MDELVQAAIAAREKAYAPYSAFRVGAAVLTAAGKIYTGCNVENASYGLTNCAERTAIFNAVAHGERALVKLAVAADTAGIPSPCGACRQVMSEFRIHTVIMANLRGDTQTATMDALLPHAFDQRDLSKGDGSNES